MRKWLSKLFAVLLTAVMLLGIAPTMAFGADAGTTDRDGGKTVHVYTAEEHALLDDGVFSEIQTIKDAAAATMGGAAKMTEADFIALIPQVIDTIECSDTYVPGTLQRNGNFLVWETTVGIPCCYDPRMEAKLAQNAIPGADPEALADTVVTSFANRGGWPGSMDIAVFQPYYGIDGSFTTQYADEGVSLAQATGGVNTTYIAGNATIDNIANSIESCGVVIFDSHGTTDYNGYNDYTSRANSSYLCLTTSVGITSQDTAPQAGPYGTYYHCMKSGSYADVDGTCISNHMDAESPNGHVWMAICLGMATDGLEAPLRNRGAEVVYGYSQSVSFTGDYRYEEYFWDKMKAGEDVKTAAAYMKQKVGNKDPYTNPPAYPIFVSDEDVYPGHGNVDRVQTVKSTWTLYTQFEVTALVNNDAWGTVTVSGSTITAAPAAGYFTAGFEVVSGEAAVTQSGNVFHVNAASDCAIQINFAPKSPAVINFSVPEGVTCAPLSAYVNDDVVLPVPTGTVTAGEYECVFMGWTTAPVEERVTVSPAYLRPGASMTVTAEEQTLYALYAYLVPEVMVEGQYSLVDRQPVNWLDDYVITYDGIKALDASGQYTGTKIGASSAVADLEDAGVVKVGMILSNVPDSLVFQVIPQGDGTCAVKMKNSDKYLALTNNADMLTTSTSVTNKSKWTLTMEGDVPVLTNAAFSGRALQYNTGATVFRAYTAGTQQPLTLYAAAKGTTWFTTDPRDPNAPTGPVITGQPADFTGPIGATASFTVAAEGQDLTYQWQYKSLKDGKWHDTKVTGYNTPTMSIGVTAARDGMQFRCKVTDASGSTAISDPATLRVEAVGPTITSQPQDFTGPIGATASFTVIAEGEGLTYQWQYKSLKDGKWHNANVTGSTAATMSIGVTAARSGMQFRCKVTDASGMTAISNAATLRVEAVGPTITSQPQDFTGAIGATASFTVAAEGEGLTYQWQYKSLKDGKWYNANVTGSTAATMSIGVTAARNGMQFRCKVTNSSGGTTISDAATLRVG